MTKRPLTLLLVAGLLGPVTLAQQPATPSSAPAQPSPGVATPSPLLVPQGPGNKGPGAAPGTPIFPAMPSSTPKFQSLVTKGADGKIVKIDGNLDALAMMRNSQIDLKALMEKSRSVVEEWAADVNQLAIDNLDWMEKIDDEGLIEKLDFNDSNQLRYIVQIMNPLISAGPLIIRMQTSGVVTGEQVGMNKVISDDYVQQCFNEIMPAVPDPIRADEGKEEQQKKIDRVNQLTHYLYYVAIRDVHEAYHQMEADAAPMADKLVESLGLSAEAAEKAKPAVAAAKKANGDTARREAVHALLKQFNFDQRRALLQKAVQMGAHKNPIEAAKRLAEAKAGG